MLHFFTVSRLALNPNLIFEMGSYYLPNLMKLNNVYNLTTLDNKDFHNDKVNSESEQTRRTGTGQSMAALEKILNHEE